MDTSKQYIVMGKLVSAINGTALASLRDGREVRQAVGYRKGELESKVRNKR